MRRKGQRWPENYKTSQKKCPTFQVLLEFEGHPEEDDLQLPAGQESLSEVGGGGDVLSKHHLLTLAVLQGREDHLRGRGGREGEGREWRGRERGRQGRRE